MQFSIAQILKLERGRAFLPDHGAHSRPVFRSRCKKRLDYSAAHDPVDHWRIGLQLEHRHEASDGFDIIVHIFVVGQVPKRLTESNVGENIHGEILRNDGEVEPPENVAVRDVFPRYQINEILHSGVDTAL